MKYSIPNEIKLYQTDNILSFRYYTDCLCIVEYFQTYQEVINNVKKLKYYNKFKYYMRKARPYLFDQFGNHLLDEKGRWKIKEKNSDLEKASFFPMVLVFNMMVNMNLSKNKKQFIPDFEDYVNKYISITCEKVGDKLKFKKGFSNCENITFTTEELKYRLGYAYPSFIRELVIKVFWTENITYFKEKYSLYDFHIKYDLNEDFGELGIDVDVIINEEKVGICIYTNTEDSRDFKYVKDNIRHNVDKNNTVHTETESIQRYNYKNEAKISISTQQVGDMFIPTEENMLNFLDKVIEDFIYNK